MPEEFNLPKVEEKILEFWSANRIFEKSLLSKVKSQRSKVKKFVFFEGPPYANGKPGIHHVLARIFKDVILRYKTMRGYYVPRRAGWDTHGLPVEMAAEKALGLKSKKDIEKFGIKRFNEEAKKAVWLYKEEWEKLTERIGYWLDLKNAYITYEPEYIETLWWTIAQIAKKKLLYKGRKVVPWCPRCGTALSSHELALGYKEVTDNSVYVKFRLAEGQTIGNWTTGKRSYILSWTTTPWTLPGNVALAVGGRIRYVAAEKDGDELWYAKESPLAKELGNVGKEIGGKDLVGLEYEPLFDVKPLHSKKSYRVYAADFVSTGEGTGVVHTAVMYGEDDYKLGQKVGLPQHHTVDEEGKFTKDVPSLGGLYVKDPKTEQKVLDHLTTNHYLLTTEPYTHEYPFCWRCDTPLLYYARTSWFIAMSKLRQKLIAANKTINWTPAHLKEGRFGEWLKEVKDWNLSRERYWGVPLPIWECVKCSNVEIVGSLDELSKKASGSTLRQAQGKRNQYWVMRHGQAKSNVANIIDSSLAKSNCLTAKGRDQVLRSAEKLKRELGRHKGQIDVIIASDIHRTKETASTAGKILGVKKIIFDRRLREVQLGVLQGCHDGRYHELFPTYESKFAQGPKNGESLRDLRKRVWEFLGDMESKYRGKNILLVSHEYPIWMMMHTALGWSEKQAIAEKKKRGDDFSGTAEVNKLEFKSVPRNDTGEVDLHRPYVDEIAFPCQKCRSKMQRIKEVADVWFDSGAMPFAQGHWPFAQNQKSKIKNQKLPKAYPADYIAEGMDQTRGWFYTLLAVATALGFKAPYKNVVSLGLINDKFGQKMSKSKGNVVEPWAVINKYGVDALRWYFYTVNPPGETKNFDEAEIAKTYRKMHLILYNSLIFYKTYVGKTVSGKRPASKNVLDKWILVRLDQVVREVTEKLDEYEIRDAALLVETFINDLSRWYIRRSRRRLSAAAKGRRGREKTDYENASATLGYVLFEAVKLIAPFTPFFAEFLYRELSGGEAGRSVHLADWPRPSRKISADKKLLDAMEEARRFASIALAKRADVGIKVRQPLSSLQIRSTKSEIRKNRALLDVLAEEINVKEVIFGAKIKGEVELDTKITPELKEEGILRELVRSVQDLRQRAGLRPGDGIVLMLELPELLRGIVLRNEAFLKKEVGAKEVAYRKAKFDAEISTKIDGEEVVLAVRKV